MDSNKRDKPPKVDKKQTYNYCLCEANPERTGKTGQ